MLSRYFCCDRRTDRRIVGSIRQDEKTLHVISCDQFVRCASWRVVWKSTDDTYQFVSCEVIPEDDRVNAQLKILAKGNLGYYHIQNEATEPIAVVEYIYRSHRIHI